MDISKKAQGIIIEKNGTKFGYAFDKKGNKEIVMVGKVKDIMFQLSKLKQRIYKD